MADPENVQKPAVADDCGLVITNMGGDENQQRVTPGALTDPALLEALRAKLYSHVADSVPNIPKHLKRKVKALKKLQLTHVNLEAQFFKELHELELKYEKSYEPLYEKRRLITTGNIELTDEDCDFPSDLDEDLADDIKKVSVDDKENPDVKNEKEEEIDVKGIPEFWLTAFKNASVVCDIIEEHDEPILKHLIDVRVVFDELPAMGFYLEFHFEPNKFFNNAVLTKYYEMKCTPDESDPFSFDGPEIIKCKGCVIDWKKGMNVTVKTIKKKQKHKARGAVRTVTKTVQNDSFFNFFSPPSAEGDEQLDEEISSALSADFEIGSYIKDRIVPQAVLYFTGENLLDDEFDEEEDEEEEEFDEDEDDDDDDEEESNHQRLARKKPGQNAQQNAQQCEAPPECKQQ